VDNSFDNGDFVLFYGSGAKSWRSTDEDYQYNKNIYSDVNYAYVKVKNTLGKRLGISPTISNTTFTSDVYYDLQRYEEDKVNLLGAFSATQGTGQLWFGDRYNTIKEYDYTDQFDLNGYVVGEDIEVNMAFAGRNDVNGSRVYIDIAEKTIDKSIFRVTTSGSSISTTKYANYVNLNEGVSIDDPTGSIKVRYPFQGNVTSEGWLDFLELRIPKTLNISNSPLLITNKESLNSPTTGLSFTGNPDHIWDVTDLAEVSEAYITDNMIKFESEEEIRMFYAFNESTAMTPTKIGAVANQNLHSINDLDMLVVFHPLFAADVERYVTHRAAYNDINIQAVDVNNIYNEFSGGKVDPTAIRDFAKMVYDRSDNFKYLMLVGDGSYDYKQIMPDVSDQNFIPVYETKESLSPIDGFPSDDYFALLDLNEGTDLIGQLDIAVGRLPVKTAEELTVLVDKFIYYDTAPQTQGDWKLRIGFAADDEESTHIVDTEKLARDTRTKYPDFNHQKIYFDAFVQESTPGGTRFPDATKEINNAVFKGLLVLNYLGHGGPKGWAQERVLQVSDIQSWNEPISKIIFITMFFDFRPNVY